MRRETSRKRMFRSILSAIMFGMSLGNGLATAGPIMYVSDSGGQLGTVDVATGAATVIGNITGSGGAAMTDIAFAPNGDLYGLTFTGLYRINPTTAAATFIGNHSISGGNALVFGSDGTLYGAGGGSTSLYTINITTGVGTSLGNMGFASGGDLAFNGGNFYLASTGDQLVKIDLNNISNTSAVGNFGVTAVYGLATGDNGILYAVADTNAYIVNTATGAATTPVSFSGHGLLYAFGQSFYAEAKPVPEPSTLSFLSIGLGLLALRRRVKS